MCQVFFTFADFRQMKRSAASATDPRGAQARNRTRDTGIFSPLLYLLSYLSKMVGHLGVEPRTDRL